MALGVERGALVGGQDATHEGVKPAVPAWPCARALVGVRRNKDRRSLSGQALHLDVVPVAGVGENHLGRLLDARSRELVAGRGDHRFELAEVGRGDVHLGGDDDLFLGRDRLGVVALHPSARCLDVARVGVGEVDLALRLLGRLIGLGRTVRAQPAAVAHPPVPSVVLVGLIGAALDLVVFFETALGLFETLGA